MVALCFRMTARMIPATASPPITHTIGIQCAITNFAAAITAYAAAHIATKAMARTNQWIADPPKPPGDASHAIRNAISPSTSKMRYSHNGEMGRASGSVINSKIKLKMGLNYYLLHKLKQSASCNRLPVFLATVFSSGFQTGTTNPRTPG